MTNQQNQDMKSPSQTIYINHLPTTQSNGLGIAGFVIALISLFVGWIPGLGWIMWLLGLILSFVGVFKQPRGLAIAGLVISCLGLILLLFVFFALGSVISQF